MSLNICLIKPPILHQSISFTLTAAPPLGLAYIAAALQMDGHQLKIIDASAEGAEVVTEFLENLFLYGLTNKNILDRIPENTDIVCLSLMFTNNWLNTRELIKEIKLKHPAVTLIAGGEHANAAPELCLRQSPLDYIVFGEGEETVRDLVSCLEQKKEVKKVKGIGFFEDNVLRKTNSRKRISDLVNIPWPAWDLFPLEKYFENKMSHGVYLGRTLPVMATRGCPYTCTFCSNPQMWGRKYEMRSPKDFVDELEYLHQNYQVTNFDLYDLTAIIFKDWIMAMCQEILDRNLNVSYQLPSGTRAEAIDFEVATLLFKSGCKNITYAPESGSKKVLKDVKKRVNISKMLASIKYSSKAGMNIKLNMIIGFPDDRHRDIWATMWFLVKCSWYGANDTAPAIFSPYPGSALFERLEKEKKINLYSDEYILEIINSYDLWPGKVYSNHISPGMIKVYTFILLLVFYGSNYLFRPQRLLRTIQNIVTQKHESRLEQILHKNFIDKLNFTKIKS